MRVAAYLSVLILVLVATSLCASSRSSRPFTHDAYVWQMQWRPEVRTSILRNQDLVDVWRVLFAQVEADGEFRSIAPDLATLQATQRPVVAVIRVEGQIARFDAPSLRAKILEKIIHLQGSLPNLTGIEIDHDCARSQLPRYAAFLADLHSRLPGRLTLSITALPDWLASPTLGEILAQTDESVLQVHAVSNPATGLFDAVQAEAWVRRYARVTPHIFHVALPTYGAQLRFDAHGNLVGVQSENQLLGDAAATRELIVPPRLVRNFLDRLQQNPPPGLAGVAWFRLPVDGDIRAWSQTTWRTVITGGPLPERLQLSAQAQEDRGLFNIVVSNPTDIDQEKPLAITLPRHCENADGVNGYTRHPSSTQSGMELRRTQAGMLHQEQSLVIGWARCARSPGGELHVAP